MWIVNPKKNWVQAFLRSPQFRLPALIFAIILMLWFVINSADFRSLFLNTRDLSIETIELQMTPGHLNRLRENASHAQKTGMLIPSDYKFKSALLNSAGKTLPIRLRLKGRWPDHFTLSSKLSFSVQIEKGMAFHGMHKFSLQSPATRNFIWEWVFQNAVKEQGGIALRYQFLKLRVNGEDWGIYALEETPDFPVIANNQRREGALLKFDADQYWREFWKGSNEPELRNTDTFISGYGFYTSLPIVPISMDKTIQDPVLFEGFQLARSRLNAFRSNQLKSSRVFDVDKMASFLALRDLFGAHHAIHTNQFRFYFNPITSRLEPISYDNDPGHLLEITAFGRSQIDWRRAIGEGGGKEYFLSQLFKDDELYLAYIGKLRRLTQGDFLKKLGHRLSDKVEPLERWIESEWPEQKEEFKNTQHVLNTNLRRIQQFLNPPHALRAYFEKGGINSVQLTVTNVQQLPIVVEKMSLGKSLNFSPIEGNLIKGKGIVNPLSYHSISFSNSRPIQWDHSIIKQLKIHYRILGTDDMRVEKVLPWNGTRGVSSMPPTLNQQAIKYSFIHINEADRQIFFQPGTWRMEHPFIIPFGFKVSIPPGTHLKMTKEGSIISHSPLHLRGPITIEGDPQFGNGLVVSGAGGPSIFRQVRFLNLSPSSTFSKNHQITGAITFYEAPVEISNCEFVSNSKGDDYLNIVRSAFSIKQSTFLNIFADAIDIDFSEGSISNSRFMQIGTRDNNGDAIDLSGSILNLTDIRINHVSDKGLSIGESSQVEAKMIDIKGAQIGIAVKDSSLFTGNEIKIEDCKTGIAGYLKKSIYGPSQLMITGLSTKKNKADRMIQEGTLVELH